MSAAAPVSPRTRRPPASSVALLAPVVATLVFFNASRAWLGDPLPILLMIGWSSLLALGLSVSRFRAPAVFAFTLLMSLGLGVLIVGRVLPDPAELLIRPPFETLWLMNIRLTTFVEDLARGIDALRSGAVPGTPLATAAYCLLAWLTVHWLVWGGLRRYAAWSGLFLCFGLLLVNDLLSGRPPGWSLELTLTGLLLVAGAAYTSRVDSWDRRGLSYPVLIWEGWAANLAAIGAVVFIATGLTTPDWRDSIQHFLDSFRPRTVPTAERTIDRGFSRSPSSFVPDLSVIGAQLPQGDETLFYVTTSDSPSGVESSGLMIPPSEQHYWRGAIYESYTGRGWSLAPLGEAVPPIDGPPPASSSRYALRQAFEILALGDDRLFAASQPVSANEPVRVRIAGMDGASTLLRGAADEYTVVSWVPRLTRDGLNAAGDDYPAAVRATYLHLPEAIPQRVRDLAARLSLGTSSAFEQAVRIQDFLRSSYPYEDAVPFAPAGRDAVDYFLFDARGGTCSYFASAMVVLLRLEGVPARVVTGFAAGDWDGQQGRYRVAESDAHAWVEVYFPAYGWTEFEPTPSRPAFDYRAAALTAAAPPGVGKAGRAGRLPSPILPAGLALGLAALVAAYVTHRRRRSRLPPEGQLRVVYWRMRRRLARDGAGARANLTPVEFMAKHEGWLVSRPRLDRAARALTAVYIRATYSPTVPTPDEIDAAHRAWRSAWWDRLRLR